MKNQDNIEVAAGKGDVATVKRILDKKAYGWFALEPALVNAIKALGRVSAVVNSDDYHNSQLMAAAKLLDSELVAVAKLLLNAKANPNWTISSSGPHEVALLVHAVRIQHSGLVKTLLDAGAYAHNRSHWAGPLVTHLIEDSLYSGTTDQNRALIAWNLFASGAPLWDSDEAQYCIINRVIDSAINYHCDASFMFLKGLNALWVSQKRYPVILPVVLKFFIEVIADIILEYSDDREKDHDFIAKNTVCEWPIYADIETTEPLFALGSALAEAQISLNIDKPFKKAILENPSGGELKVENQSIFVFSPLMLAAAMGDCEIAEGLLKSKKSIDLTVSLSGNTALIWSMRGRTDGHARIAKTLALMLGRK